MWDVQTGVEIWKTPSGSHTWCVTSVAFSLNGKQVVSGSSDYTLRFWDSETGEARSGHLWGGHRGPVWSIAISRDGQKIVSGSDDSTIRVWRAETGEAVGQLLRIHEGRVNSVAFSPDGRYFASGGADHMIHIWDTETGMPKGAPLIGHAGIVRCVAFSPDGRSIASCSDDRTIRIWDAGLDPEWESFQALHGSWDCQRFALSRHPAHQMKQLYASDSTETTAVWYDRETGWIMGNEMDHILWIPPHLFDRVSVGRMKVLIPGPALVVDLSKFAHGTEWQTCFTDSSS
ncbi:WD40 repeat-like protein, partial [Calocera viscosa TUFC12733]